MALNGVRNIDINYLYWPSTVSRNSWPAINKYSLVIIHLLLGWVDCVWKVYKYLWI